MSAGYGVTGAALIAMVSFGPATSFLVIQLRSSINR
jgi:hypothetical protein